MAYTKAEKKELLDKVRATIKEVAGNPATLEALRQRYAQVLNPAPDANGNAHPYSLHNTLMIAVQRPDATLCAGFKQWRKLGRQVRKGESGLLIWYPTQRKTDPDDENATATETSFLTGYVFDVTQTDPITQPAPATSPTLQEAFQV